MLAFAASVLAVDSGTVRDDLASIKTLLETLQRDSDAVVSGIPGLPRALQVQVDAVGVDEQLLVATENARESPPFGSGSLNVGLDLIRLEPTIGETLQTIRDKKNDFGELGVIVLSSLYQLNDDTKQFSDAVVEKLGPLEQAIAPAVIKKIQESFDDAIRTYGGKGRPSLSDHPCISLI